MPVTITERKEEKRKENFVFYRQVFNSEEEVRAMAQHLKQFFQTIAFNERKMEIIIYALPQ